LLHGLRPGSSCSILSGTTFSKGTKQAAASSTGRDAPYSGGHITVHIAGGYHLTKWEKANFNSYTEKKWKRDKGEENPDI